MAMLEEHRNTLYQYFTTRLGKEATQALLSYFPSRDLDDPATKADLQLVRAEIKLVQVDIELVRTEMVTMEARLRSEVKDAENRLTTRMVALAGVGLAAMTLLFNVYS